MTEVISGGKDAARYRLLVELAPRGPWASLRLKVEGRVYWLSWNGERLSRSDELRRLCTTHPTVAEELTAFLEAQLPLRPEHHPATR